MIWGLIQEALVTPDIFVMISLILIQLCAFVVISFVELSILEWVNVFDIKTNTILTFITVVVIRLTYVI